MKSDFNLFLVWFFLFIFYETQRTACMVGDRNDALEHLRINLLGHLELIVLGKSQDAYDDCICILEPNTIPTTISIYLAVNTLLKTCAYRDEFSCSHPSSKMKP